VRVLLDECMPRKLRRELPEHDVRTVVEAGWGGTKNGALLRKAAEEFDVLLTVDSNMEYQQNTAELPIAVVVLVAYSNDVDVLRPLMPRVRDLLPEVEPGRLYHVGPFAG
jgi:predicted nuclease of predicted toxin-antitoxin system